MAKTRAPRPDDDNNKNAADLVAAAFILEEKSSTSLLYNSQTIDYMTNSIEAGQSQVAWFYWSRLPELRYVSRYIANALSVATLYVGKTDGTGNPPTRLESGPAFDLMRDFGGGHVGQSEILDRLGLHLTVAGDSVLIGPKNGANSLQAPFDQWRVYSNEEVHSRNGKVYLKFPGNAKEVPVPDGAMSVRIWRPHPRLWWDADSPVKGSFQVLKELDMLNKHILASGDSRLSGAGLLGIPEELDLPQPETEVDGTEVDNFVAMLIEVMSAAKKNPESAAARVPIIIRGPAEYIQAIKHFDFSTEFSQMVPELRMGAIRRLALGMDVPPEILLGSENSNSWSAWQTDESTLRVHLIPLLQLIASSLTVGWLRPMLESLPLSEAEKAEIPNTVIHFNTDNLQIRQDVSGDAQAAYDRFEIDSDHLRIALGYGPDSEPTQEELARQILLKLVSTGDPGLVAYAIDSLRKEFGVEKLPKVPSPEAGASGAPAPASPPPAPKTTPVKGPLPGERSQAKQTSPPPKPKTDGDQGNNSVGG